MTNVPGGPRRLPAYEACLVDAIAHSGALVRRAVARSRDTMAAQQAGKSPQGVHAHAIPEVLQLLAKHGEVLAVRFPDALQDVLDAEEDGEDDDTPHARPEAEGMALARPRQTLLDMVAAPLAEFNSLVSAARGLTVVRADANALAPDFYLRALQMLVDRIDASKVERVLCMQLLTAALGAELAAEYGRLSALLQADGVHPVAPAAPAAEPVQVAVTPPAPPAEPYVAPMEMTLAAQRIAAEIAAWPDFDRVPLAVRNFVCGPWAEVIAKARANAGAGPTDPGSAYAMVRPLFWSAQPELGRSDVQRLMVMVPSLVSRLRTGLKTIDYPEDKTEAFFKSLNELHGIAARAPGSSFAVRKGNRPGGPGATGGAGEIPRSGGSGVPETMPDHTLNVSATALEVLYIGVWVETFSGGKGWKRMQLSWISPKRALMLFTGDDGSTESMSRRGCLRRMRDGQLRIVPDLDLDDVFG